MITIVFFEIIDFSSMNVEAFLFHRSIATRIFKIKTSPKLFTVANRNMRWKILCIRKHLQTMLKSMKRK
uniref:Uncharacterized protein n=1 Tax=Rhizophora mucronata TaxID=61149 RepID=A0A2P2QGQ5_RHIMU